MPIENLLTKIIVNTNRLPYEKQKQLLEITEEWLSQAASGSKDLPSIKAAVDQPEYLQQSMHPVSPSNPPPPAHSPDDIEPKSPSQPISSSEPLPEVFTPISTKEELVVNIIEERAYERKDLSIPIDFVSSGQLYKEVTKDLSAGGLFIKTKKLNKFKKNQKISMVFMLSEDKKPFKLTGKVIRVEPEGLAVQFHNISPFECVAIEEELSNPS